MVRFAMTLYLLDVVNDFRERRRIELNIVAFFTPNGVNRHRPQVTHDFIFADIGDEQRDALVIFERERYSAPIARHKWTHINDMLRGDDGGVARFEGLPLQNQAQIGQDGIQRGDGGMPLII